MGLIPMDPTHISSCFLSFSTAPIEKLRHEEDHDAPKKKKPQSSDEQDHSQGEAPTCFSRRRPLHCCYYFPLGHGNHNCMAVRMIGTDLNRKSRGAKKRSVYAPVFQ